MTSEEHFQEIERIVKENATELISAIENRKPYSEIYKLLIIGQFYKVHRELNDNKELYLKQTK